MSAARCSRSGPTPAPVRAETGNTSSPMSSSAAAVSTCTVRARSSRSTLLTASTTGTPAPRSAWAMKRSPGPIPSSPLTTNSAASESASSRSTRRCMRSVSASRGRWTPGRSTSTIWWSAPVATPRIARRVVCGLSETIATLRPTSPLTSVDLPTFGRPATATKPDRTVPCVPLTSTCSPPQQLGLEREHLAVVGLVVHAGEVKRAVDDRLAQVRGVRRADDDVAELAGPGRLAGLVDRERQHVGGPVLAAVRGVQRGDPPGVDELDRDVAVLHAGRRERKRHEAPNLGLRRLVRAAVPDDLDIEQRGYARRRSAGRSAGRSSGAAFSECSL